MTDTIVKSCAFVLALAPSLGMSARVLAAPSAVSAVHLPAPATD